MKSVCMAVLCLTLAGCGLPGAGVASIPTQPFRPSAINAVLDKYADAVCPSATDRSACTGIAAGRPKPNSWLASMEACGAIAGAVPDTHADRVNCKSIRDTMSSELTLAINYNYNQYSGNIIAGQAKSNFYIGGLRSGLETGATLIGGEGVKTVLSSLSVLTGNIQTSANEEFYYEQSAPALIQAMDAGRQEVRAEIQRKLKQPYRAYPIPDLVDDLNAYYRAGTMADAITKLQQDAAVAQAAAKTKLLCTQKATDVAEANRC